MALCARTLFSQFPDTYIAPVPRSTQRSTKFATLELQMWKKGKSIRRWRVQNPKPHPHMSRLRIFLKFMTATRHDPPWYPRLRQYTLTTPTMSAFRFARRRERTPCPKVRDARSMSMPCCSRKTAITTSYDLARAWKAIGRKVHDRVFGSVKMSRYRSDDCSQSCGIKHCALSCNRSLNTTSSGNELSKWRMH